jgi:hypothetical protein
MGGESDSFLAEGLAKYVEEHPERFQSRCSLCAKPFLYFPVKDKIRVLDDETFAHQQCPEE